MLNKIMKMKNQKRNSETYLKLLINANSAEDYKNFEEFYEDTSHHDEKFLRVHLQFFQAHLLKIENQNHVLINENTELKKQLSNISPKNNFLNSNQIIL